MHINSIDYYMLLLSTPLPTPLHPVRSLKLYYAFAAPRPAVLTNASLAI